VKRKCGMDWMNVNISAPNLAVICIDRVWDDNYIGRIYHKFHRGAIEFGKIEQIVLVIERLCDKIGYPQRTTKLRQFESGSTTEKREEVLQVADSNTILEQIGPLGTFVVHVKYRQHSTWQGEVVWAEKGIKKTFRSALELLKLIDGAIETNIEEGGT